MLLDPPTCLITLVSSLREIPTVVVLHHPFLFGENTYVVLATSKGISGTVAWEDQVKIVSHQRANFWRRCRGGSSQDSLPSTCQFLASLPGDIMNIIRFLVTNLISFQFTLFVICLSFSSPPLHKNLPFYSPLFHLPFCLFYIFACVAMCFLFACIFAC